MNLFLIFEAFYFSFNFRSLSALYWWIIMTHTFSPRYFHKVSTISFSGNSLWEDLVVLKRTVVVVLPLSLDLPSSIISDGSASRGIPGHCQMVMYRWTGALDRAQSGLIIVISVFGLFLLSLGHAHFQFNFTISIHSLSLFNFFFFFNFYFYRGTSGSLSSSSFSSSGFFSWTSFLAGFFDHFPFPVFDFLGGGISSSDSSLILIHPHPFF